MLEAVKVALDPTPRQERLLEGHAGAARFAYNLMLAHIQSQLARNEKADWSMYAQRRWWNEWKNEIAPWWAEYSKEAYNSAFESLAAALKNHFASKTGRRKGRRMGWPKFKSKRHTTPRFAYTTGSFGLVEGDPKVLKLPRVGRVHCMEDIARRVGDAKVVRMSVSKHAGRWYASLTVERDAPTVPVTPKGGVGVDLGVKTLATLSDGTMAPNPRHMNNSLRRLAHAQRTLSRREQGSKRWQKAENRVRRIYAHVAAQRRDGLHKLTDWLTRTYADISIEDLNVAGMVSNHRLAQAVSDCGFAELRRQLVYKRARTGAAIHIIDRWYPSSRTCSSCGTVKAKLSLNERTYCCDACGLRIDRDLNAAINIQVAGSAPETLNARGGDIRHDRHAPAAQTPMNREPSSQNNGMRLGADLGNGVMQTTAN
ncbi:IS607 family element transposase accessory protein TnpB [Bifidobacterium pseudolongum]|uniref:IS607 family element RNA-guided endonuclease TnpB n=1 Tax=Bifidobacterium pseudolongum TaxID=1694 RepID=UPI001F102B1E|nr:IS607 family element RNA-guided endonuclease TnpB [Bifidobacterium pseudolongum]MCH4851374.1 IS607 family element transposase accessory protein TnpB [Bifidobacterium pseudolongum]